MQSPERTRQAEKDLLKDLSKEPEEKGQAKFDLMLMSFQRLLRRGAITNLGKMLGRMHPADIAKVIVHLPSPKEKRTVFELVRGEAERGKVLSEMDQASIEQVLTEMPPADVAGLLKDLGTDDVADILGGLPQEQANAILALMKTEDSTEIADLLKYPRTRPAAS
jgi:magnesium transporter